MDFMACLHTHGIHLTRQQEQAVLAVSGPALLLAVPGSGKTTVLISRLANLIQAHGVPPQRILPLTFSRRAAADMAQRYGAVFGGSAPRFSTIHSFCYGVVRQISERYKRPLPQLVTDNQALVRMLYLHLEEARFIGQDKLEELANAIGYCKNRLADEEQIASLPIEDCDFPALYRAYHAHLRENHLMDYDDLLLFTYDMFRKNPSFLSLYQRQYVHISVDEAQDTSLVQHEILSLLAKKSGSLFLVGDEDQSIYGFRGASPEALLSFPSRYPGGVILKMERNFRSTGEIIKASNRLIACNAARIEKRMEAVREEGAPVAVHPVDSPFDQYACIARLLQEGFPGSAALLYRNNESAVALADTLERAGIPFSLHQPRDLFFRTAHVREITAFLRLALDPCDLESFTRVYSKTNAYYSRTVCDYAAQAHRAGTPVLDTVAACPAADATRTALLKTRLSRMAKQPPLEALCTLEESVLRSSYFQAESASRRFGLLKSIASGQDTLPAFLQRLEALEALLSNAGRSPAPSDGAVILSTIHASKGLEYDRVILVDLIEGQFPPASCLERLCQGERAPFEEEVRLCYVGATRARSRLDLIAFREGGPGPAPSRFITMLTAQKPPAAPAAKKPGSSRVFTPPEGFTPVTDAAVLVPGLRVLHASFGEGRVLRAENGYLTWFDGVQTKRLSLHACLENKLLFIKQ